MKKQFIPFLLAAVISSGSLALEEKALVNGSFERIKNLFHSEENALPIADYTQISTNPSYFKGACFNREDQAETRQLVIEKMYISRKTKYFGPLFRDQFDKENIIEVFFTYRSGSPGAILISRRGLKYYEDGMEPPTVLTTFFSDLGDQKTLTHKNAVEQTDFRWIQAEEEGLFWVARIKTTIAEEYPVKIQYCYYWLR